MMKYFLILIFAILICDFIKTNSLDATFNPADDDQLPLSSNYRNSLRSLCDIIKKGGKLPSSFAEKEEIIKKQCAQLMKDDNHISTYSPSFSFNSKSLIFTILSITGAFIYFNKDHPFAKKTINYFRKWGNSKPIVTSPLRRPSFTKKQDSPYKITVIPSNDINAIREARMKRFEQLKNESASKNRDDIEES